MGAESKEKEMGLNTPLIQNPLLTGLPLNPLNPIGLPEIPIPFDPSKIFGPKPLLPGELPLGINNGLPIQKLPGPQQPGITGAITGLPAGKTITLTDLPGGAGGIVGGQKPSSRPEQPVQPGGTNGGPGGKPTSRGGGGSRTGGNNGGTGGPGQIVRGRKPSQRDEVSPGRGGNTGGTGSGGRLVKTTGPTRSPQTRPADKPLRKQMSNTGSGSFAAGGSGGGLGSGASRRSKSNGRSWAQRFRGNAEASLTASNPTMISTATVIPHVAVVKPVVAPTMVPVAQQLANNIGTGQSNSQVVSNSKVVGSKAASSR